MNFIRVICATCGKTFSRPVGRVNKAKKFGWKQFGSAKGLTCQNEGVDVSLCKS